MRKLIFCLLLILVVPVFLVMGADCAPQTPMPGTGDGSDTGTGDGSGTTDDGSSSDSGSSTTGLTIVKTNIAVRHDADLECGDDLIAFGTETESSSIIGVSYIIPSQAPTSGTPVPNSELYSNKAFAVGGRTIFLVGSNIGSLAFQVSVYDVDSATITQTYDTTDIRLNSIPVAANDTGHIQADGDYCVVICDPNTVTDGKMLKVIDVSSGTPTLIAFDQNPDEYVSRIQQVAVDAATMRAVAVAGSTSDMNIYIYDISNPTAAPTTIDAPNGVSDNTQIQISGNYIIGLDDQAYGVAFIVDLTTNSVVSLTDGLATGDMDIGGTTFAFFADADSNDYSGGSQRAAVGTAPGPGYTKAALGNQIDGSTNNNGLVGFASDISVTPNGGYIFLSGAYLQYSTSGVSFVVPADPNGVDPYGCKAWRIDSSSNTVGFHTSMTYAGGDKILGYIILP